MMADQQRLTLLSWIGDVFSIKQLIPEVCVKPRVLVLDCSFV